MSDERQRLTALGVVDAARALSDATVSSVALTMACQRAVHETNPELNAFVTVDETGALEAARDSDERRRAGAARSQLDGIPIGIKDNIDVAGLPTSNGIAKGKLAVRDAEVVSRLREAGMVILGKLNMHEAALGTTTNNPHFGATMNPCRVGYTSGGSSGGSGAAVAAGLCPVALGTDTMGSVRLPAAHCGVFGLKPSRGRVSNVGVVELLDELDVVGPLARSIEDLAAVLAVLGADAGFSSNGEATPAPPFARESPPAPRLGMLAPFASQPLEDDVARVFEASVARLRTHFEVDTIELGDFDPARARLAGLVLIEARLAGTMGARARAQVSPALRKFLEFGDALSSTQLEKARATLNALEASAPEVFERCDAVLAPVAPIAPHCIDTEPPASVADFLPLANVLGAPAVAIPAGKNAFGLPIGLQLMAAPGRDQDLLGWSSQVFEVLQA